MQWNGIREAAARVTVVSIVAAWLVVSTLIFYGAFAVATYNPDYSVFWTVGRLALSEPSRLYDSEFVTAAQHWLIIGNPRPWAYPPSAILPILPLAVLPFWASFAAWNALSIAAFWAACRKIVSGWGLALALVAPPVARAIYAGQFSLILSALAIFGLAARRPLLGGALLGIGAAIKPQLFLFAPLMLNRQGLAGFFAAGLVMVIGSLPFGPQLWADWLIALPSFTRTVADMGIMDRGVSPLSTAAWLGIDGTALQWAGVVAGIALAIWARRGDLETRLFGMIAGAILCSPYVLFYDLSLLVPVFAAALLSARPMGIVQGLPPIFPVAPIAFPLAVVAFVADRRHVDGPQQCVREERPGLVGDESRPEPAVVTGTCER